MIIIDRRSIKHLSLMMLVCLLVPALANGQIGPFKAVEYGALFPGNIWRYFKNGELVTSTVSNHTVNVNGVPTWPVISSEGDVNYVTNDENGSRLHRAEYLNGDIAVFDPPVLEVTPLFNIGQSINSVGVVRLTVAGVGTFDLNYSSSTFIEGIQRVEVPLGVFDAIYSTVQARIAGTALGQRIDVSSIGRGWFAKHYGPVKEIVSADFDTEIYELVSVWIDTDDDNINVTADNCPAVSNSEQLDFDKDGLGDVCDADDDNDRLADTEEPQLGTDPYDKDTDDDGLDDGYEISNGLDPLDGICPSFICGGGGSWRRILPLIAN